MNKDNILKNNLDLTEENPEVKKLLEEKMKLKEDQQRKIIESEKNDKMKNILLDLLKGF